jgi:ribA/ribD-fused uncharacterized protein
MIIDRFTGENEFLSNFYEQEFSWTGLTWKTSEHAFQASKAIYLADFAMIKSAKTPAEAKRLGGQVRMVAGWDDKRIDVMYQVCKAKFMVPELREKLLATGDHELIEGNNHNDKFWGKVGNIGKNNLGKVLMRIRKELRDGSESKT